MYLIRSYCSRNGNFIWVVWSFGAILRGDFSTQTHGPLAWPNEKRAFGLGCTSFNEKALSSYVSQYGTLVQCSAPVVLGAHVDFCFKVWDPNARSSAARKLSSEVRLSIGQFCASNFLVISLVFLPLRSKLETIENRESSEMTKTWGERSQTSVWTSYYLVQSKSIF